MTSGKSAVRATCLGFPLSSDSRVASSSMLASIKSARRFKSFPRSEADIRLQTDLAWKALRAAFTASSTSGASASATLASTSPVAGLMVSKLLPDTLSTHLLSIRIFVCLIKFAVLGGSVRTVAMELLPQNTNGIYPEPSYANRNQPSARNADPLPLFAESHNQHAILSILQKEVPEHRAVDFHSACLQLTRGIRYA